MADNPQLNDFIKRLVHEAGAMANGPLVILGDKLGLYRRLAADGPLTSTQLAERTGTAERYVREWLAAQAASGFVEYDAERNAFHMLPHQVMAFVDESSPIYSVGTFYNVSALFSAEPKLLDAFRTGKGVPWGDHHEHLFCGTAKFFRRTYLHYLVQEWIPSLDGMLEKLERGARVADVGCGFGVSTLLLAQRFPNSTFVGFDIHEASLQRAREDAASAGVTNLTYENGTAKSYPGTNYDLVAFFDSLHDMGDPVGAARHVHETLADDGSWMIIEPFARDALKDNLNPIGRIYYAASTMLCTPASLSQEVGMALGAQAGEARMREVVTQGGFTCFRRTAETAFNIVYEARR